MHTCIHAYMHTCIHAYMHICMHTYIHTCMHTCTYAYIHTYMHTCIHAYMHTCTHAYIHTYKHTYKHTLAMAFCVGVWHIIIAYCRSDDDIDAFINAAAIIMPHPQVSSSRLVGVWIEGCLGEKWVPVGGNGKERAYDRRDQCNESREEEMTLHIAHCPGMYVCMSVWSQGVEDGWSKGVRV